MAVVHTVISVVFFGERNVHILYIFTNYDAKIQPNPKMKQISVNMPHTGQMI